MLNIPVKGDGTIDDKEVAILENIAAWMDINKESIFNTRPWKQYGEGPASEVANPVNSEVAKPVNALEFNEGKVKLSAKDIRYNQKGNVLYATVLGVPTANVSLKLLGKKKDNATISSIKVLGSKEKLSWKQYPDSLVIQKPKTIPNKIAVVFKINLK
ncbi:MAG: alpha-L-fucosidase C-terminal domain-containing protein [Ferruginibacter sp.]